MTIEAMERDLFRCVEGTAVAAPEGSTAARAADNIIDMVHAYYSDGCGFVRVGDLPNALASFAYGRGWCDAGCALGMLRWTGTPGAASEKDSAADEKCTQKARHYRQLLEDAIDAVECAPERGSVFFTGAVVIFRSAQSHFRAGRECLDQGESSRALWHFSYGHGWLDAGVRIGLFRIHKKRDLFPL